MVEQDIFLFKGQSRGFSKGGINKRQITGSESSLFGYI
jgi:hypothetical protein